MNNIWEKILFPPVYLNTKKVGEGVKGKTILITGASRGIGRATAELLSSFDVKLILVARSLEKLIEVKEFVHKAGAFAQIIQADIRKEEEVQMIIESITEVDIIISNAGKSIRRSLWESLDRFTDVQRTIHVNYLGPTQLILGLLPKLCEGGVVINVSALNVLLHPAKKWAVYQASKAAFDQWFRSIISELGEKKIKGKSVYLPLVRTDMIAPTAHYEKYPAMSAEEVARIIVRLLVSRRTRYRPYWLPFVQLLDFFLGQFWWKRQ
ncbi:SDR family NAD(P)-dependent oxidoreductase [Parvicella tangerina]|uniref:Fatty acyl-CoA reductase n=1 Tax=Parvicella tangerina TaxID=2829795 RepID=A0A916NG40_9FLAO|nr:SDR family NAD(P)-dependent oxidoreductase [Parvicella tangerina]CAG5079849.1 Fatty acyl-CoA reductase [Parvicella tangerina]